MVATPLPIGRSRFRSRTRVLRSNRAAVIAGVVLALIVALALLAPVISPYDPVAPTANFTSYTIDIPRGSAAAAVRSVQVFAAGSRIYAPSRRFVRDDGIWEIGERPLTTPSRTFP